MSKILITGGAGNIGSALARQLLSLEQHHVVVVDNLLTGKINKVPKHERLTFVNADVNEYHDIMPIFARFDFDYVFHLAAVVGVKRTLANPIKVLHDIEGIKNILALSKNTGVERVFYSSSSEVYGEPFEIPQNENTTPLNSRLPYAIVKNVGESFFKAYQREYGLDYTIFRFFNTYGPLQSEDFVVPKFVKAALNNQPLVVYGDGLQTRSFCYVDDTVQTCVKAFLENKYINDVLNVGNDREITVLELAHKIIELTGSNSKIVHAPALPEGDMQRRCPDNIKMKKLLNRELVGLEEGLGYLVDFYNEKIFN